MDVGGGQLGVAWKLVNRLRDEFVVGVKCFGIGFIREEFRDGVEFVFASVGEELVVAVLQHERGVAVGEGDGAGVEVDVNGVASPMAEAGDDVFANIGAEERGGAASTQGTGVDSVRWDAGEVLAAGGGKA